MIRKNIPSMILSLVIPLSANAFEIAPFLALYPCFYSYCFFLSFSFLPLPRLLIDDCSYIIEMHKLFVRENNLLENFNEIIAAIASYIINKPELLSDEANRLFKERKKAVKDIKKRDIYEEIIDSRFNTAQKHQDLQNWFFNLKEALLHQFSGKWSCITKNNDGIIDGYILF